MFSISSSTECHRLIQSSTVLICLWVVPKKKITKKKHILWFAWQVNRWGDMSDRIIGHPTDVSIDALVSLDENTICTGASDGHIRLVSLIHHKSTNSLSYPISCSRLWVLCLFTPFNFSLVSVFPNRMLGTFGRHRNGVEAFALSRKCQLYFPLVLLRQLAIFSYIFYLEFFQVIIDFHALFN